MRGPEHHIRTGSPNDQTHDHNIPCVLCQANELANKITIRFHYECPEHQVLQLPDGWVS